MTVRLSGVAAGDVVQVMNEHGRPDPLIVYRRCPHGTAFYCLTHHQALANRYQLDVHTEAGAHVIARRCPTHGIEAFDPGD